MNAPTPDEREDRPFDSPPAFDLQHRLDDAVIMTVVGNYRIDRPTAGGRSGKTLQQTL